MNGHLHLQRQKYNVESIETMAHLEKIANQVNLVPASRSLKHIGENSKQAASVSCKWISKIC